MVSFSKLLNMTTCLFLLKSIFTTSSLNKKGCLFMKKDFPNSLKSFAPFYKPKTMNQEVYNNYLNDPKIKVLFVIGPAGTGKTILACNNAIKELKNGSIKKVILTRPVVPVEEDIGFLPGNINKKMDPWTKPIFDVFLEFYSQKDIDTMVQNNIIEIAPLAYMRGRTFKNAFIIADEMQNSSPNQMLMLTTRIGDGSKMVLTGDLNQSDKGSLSGLSEFISKIKLYEKFITKKIDIFRYLNNTKAEDLLKLSETGIKIVEMNNTDIERSPVIKKILDIYSFDEEQFTKEIKNLEGVKDTDPDLDPDLDQKHDSYKTETNVNGNYDCALIPIKHISKNYNKFVDKKNNK